MTALSLAQSAPGRWVARAACASHPELSWFPEQYPTSTYRARVEQAKQVCHPCPVRSECLQHAQNVDEEHGIWGGVDMTRRRGQRAPEHRKRRPIKHGTSGGFAAHHRRGEDACVWCRMANVDYLQRYRLANHA